jgi:hypothetical protein
MQKLRAARADYKSIPTGSSDFWTHQRLFEQLLRQTVGVVKEVRVRDKGSDLGLGLDANHFRMCIYAYLSMP